MTVAVETPSVKISIDGEVRHLRPPLHFTIRPRALRVVGHPPAC
jgi:diacylglycerol kinase family enzyme